MAEPVDITDMLGDEDALKEYQNQKLAFKGLAVEPTGDKGAAFMYGWDGSVSEGDDLYFNASKDGQTCTFVIESYLCGPDTDVYRAVKKLNVGDTIDMEGFLYWYEGAQPHITHVEVDS